MALIHWFLMSCVVVVGMVVVIIVLISISSSLGIEMRETDRPVPTNFLPRVCVSNSLAGRRSFRGPLAGTRGRDERGGCGISCWWTQWANWATLESGPASSYE